MAHLLPGMYRKTDGAVLNCDWLVGLKLDIREIDGAVPIFPLPSSIFRHI